MKALECSLNNQIIVCSSFVNMENIYTVSKPLLTVARLMGLFPMSFNGRPREKCLKIRYLYVLTSIFWLVSSIYLFALTISFDYGYDNSKMLTRVWKMVILLKHFSMIFNFCYQIFKIKNMLKFMTKIQESDEMVRNKKQFKKKLVELVLSFRLNPSTFSQTSNHTR